MSWQLIPFAGAGAISEATGTIIEKKILRSHKIGFKRYYFYIFLIISLIMIPFLFYFWRVSPEALEWKNLLVLAFIISCSMLANFFIFYAMKWEKITELEPIRLFQPLFVIFLAFVFYPSERSSPAPMLIAAFVAAIALVVSHLKKHHFQFNKYLIATLLGSLFFAIELAASKEIVSFYSPLSLYFIRCSIICLVSFFMFKSYLGPMPKKTWLYAIVAAIIWICYRMLLYSGYEIYGVIFTTLLFILAPVFIYLFASIYLKEKITWKNLIATIIITVCVVYAIFTKA